MPPALMEGFESLLLFIAIIMKPELQTWLYALFTMGVVITILQRLYWCSNNI